ncbi:MarR family winged helix-turn-helix transcriptional regulator [Streptomyces sp. ASQP_92]|uniref:MarR family winged helix-turn-helix transcriptional regulator n=1 Tax=Streptomyces sp. ASQP_92 TaxID=2979116 RepID=UPI0021BF4370|nr:MarR family winged helix-turn-helix transcriptional regulator [Streptomyces sp. ASQP_92]MCT9092552.1 MarR family winged helix-turn-helix transcriptional regulator [Streptomyces sp. ASQP_92]
MHVTGRSLPQLLTEARRWFEDALLASLEEAEVAPVSPTQIQLFSVLDTEGTTVSELARRTGVTRQTAHQAVHGLVAAGLLEQTPDPSSGRQRLIRRTALGERAHRQAGVVLERLEDELAERIGRAAVEALRSALETPWGAPPVLPPSPGEGRPGARTSG